MTVTPKGVGVSAGTRGARVSAHSSGRVTRTLGVPGSGISHVKAIRGATSGGSPARVAAPPAPKPGLLAPRWEKDLYQAVASGSADKLRAAADATPAQSAAIWLAVVDSAPALDDRYRNGLERLWEEGADPASLPFVAKYTPDLVVSIALTDVIEVVVPADRDSLGLLLAEARQADGDLTAAIDLVEQLTPSTTTAVSLAELYIAASRWEDVVDLSDGLTNSDELATYLLIQRGVALREIGHLDAAREALKAALAARSRPAELRHLALIERARTLQASGKTALARKDLETVLAQDASYPGLRDYLTSLAG